MAFLGALGLVLVVVVLGVAVNIGSTDEPQTRRADPPSPPTTPRATTRPTSTPTATVSSAEQQLWAYGLCRELSNERDRTEYQAARNSGSARRLRGRVLVLHLRLNPPGESWSSSNVAKVNSAAVAGKRFYHQEAARYGVSDLKVEPLPWTLTAPVYLPALRPNQANLLSPATQNQIRAASRKAIESALGKKLESVVQGYRRQGYDEVAFLVYFPIRTSARAFAWFALSGYSKNYPDVGYLFAERDDLSTISVVAAHEGLHLFGARDLYRLQPKDSRDRFDLMNDYCVGFQQTQIGEATAYAIGWRDQPPPRAYRFLSR